MATRVTNVRVKDGKIVRVYKLSVSKKIGQKAKTERAMKAWKTRTKK